jgi:hypothetical protein
MTPHGGDDHRPDPSVSKLSACHAHQFRKPVNTPASHSDAYRLALADAGFGDGLVEPGCKCRFDILDLPAGIRHVNLKKRWKGEIL